MMRGGEMSDDESEEDEELEREENGDADFQFVEPRLGQRGHEWVFLFYFYFPLLIDDFVPFLWEELVDAMGEGKGLFLDQMNQMSHKTMTRNRTRTSRRKRVRISAEIIDRVSMVSFFEYDEDHLHLSPQLSLFLCQSLFLFLFCGSPFFLLFFSLVSERK
jgi:hypothetical protein